MRRALGVVAIAFAQLSCAGRVAPTMTLSREPRGTDVTLLPAAIALLERPGRLSLQLEKPAYVTVFELTPSGDSLRVAFATSVDTIGALDGSATVQVDANARQILASDTQESLVRESCVVVPRGAGDRRLSLCSANGDATSVRRGIPAVSWRFTHPLVLLATAEPYNGAVRIPVAWFYRVDGVPPSVNSAWGAIPFGPPLPPAR